jgi:hypothetical protein
MHHNNYTSIISQKTQKVNTVVGRDYKTQNHARRGVRFCVRLHMGVTEQCRIGKDS